MKNKQLTIIIPFLNEGEEIANTLFSIKDTVTEMPNILLINDASTDEYDYQSIAEQYNCEYIQHEKRLGVAESRNEGVRICGTPYFLLLDGVSLCRTQQHGSAPYARTIGRANVWRRLPREPRTSFRCSDGWIRQTGGSARR